METGWRREEAAEATGRLQAEDAWRREREEWLKERKSLTHRCERLEREVATQRDEAAAVEEGHLFELEVAQAEAKAKQAEVEAGRAEAKALRRVSDVLRKQVEDTEVVKETKAEDGKVEEAKSEEAKAEGGAYWLRQRRSAAAEENAEEDTAEAEDVKLRDLLPLHVTTADEEEVEEAGEQEEGTQPTVQPPLSCLAALSPNGCFGTAALEAVAPSPSAAQCATTLHAISPLGSFVGAAIEAAAAASPRGSFGRAAIEAASPRPACITTGDAVAAAVTAEHASDVRSPSGGFGSIAMERALSSHSPRAMTQEQAAERAAQAAAEAEQAEAAHGEVAATDAESDAEGAAGARDASMARAAAADADALCALEEEAFTSGLVNEVHEQLLVTELRLAEGATTTAVNAAASLNRSISLAVASMPSLPPPPVEQRAAVPTTAEQASEQASEQPAVAAPIAAPTIAPVVAPVVAPAAAPVALVEAQLANTAIEGALATAAATAAATSAAAPASPVTTAPTPLGLSPSLTATAASTVSIETDSVSVQTDAAEVSQVLVAAAAMQEATAAQEAAAAAAQAASVRGVVVALPAPSASSLMVREVATAVAARAVTHAATNAAASVAASTHEQHLYQQQVQLFQQQREQQQHAQQMRSQQQQAPQLRLSFSPTPASAASYPPTEPSATPLLLRYQAFDSLACGLVPLTPTRRGAVSPHEAATPASPAAVPTTYPEPATPAPASIASSSIGTQPQQTGDVNPPERFRMLATLERSRAICDDLETRLRSLDQTPAFPSPAVAPTTESAMPSITSRASSEAGSVTCSSAGSLHSTGSLHGSPRQSRGSSTPLAGPSERRKRAQSERQSSGALLAKLQDEVRDA